MVVKGGESFPSTDFRFDQRTRHLVACALNWVFDFYFSADFEFIESGTCRHLTTFVTRTYGTGPNQILYKRVHDAQLQRLGNGALTEPALYSVHGDQIAFIFSEYTFVVLMEGKEYVSSEYSFDQKTRNVRAKAHLWRFDFYFSRDYSYVEKGSYYNVHNGETLHFGTGLGQLFFEKDTGGGSATHFVLRLPSFFLWFDVFFLLSVADVHIKF